MKDYGLEYKVALIYDKVIIYNNNDSNYDIQILENVAKSAMKDIKEIKKISCNRFRPYYSSTINDFGRCDIYASKKSIECYIPLAFNAAFSIATNCSTLEEKQDFYIKCIETQNALIDMFYI